MVEPPYMPESLVPVYFKGGRFAHPSIHTKKSPANPHNDAGGTTRVSTENTRRKRERRSRLWDDDGGIRFTTKGGMYKSAGNSPNDLAA